MARTTSTTINNTAKEVLSTVATLSSFSVSFNKISHLQSSPHYDPSPLYEFSSNSFYFSSPTYIEEIRLPRQRCGQITETPPLSSTYATTVKQIIFTLEVKRKKVKAKYLFSFFKPSQMSKYIEPLHQLYLNGLGKGLLYTPLIQLLWLLFCFSSLTQNSGADCPNVCECKWKSGKESVLCFNGNLTYIPALLDPGTQVLDLTGNDIATIPDDMFTLVKLLNLQKIFLAKCQLSVIEPYALRGLINLVELDLSYNSLLSIPSEAFQWITELRELKMNGNPLNFISNNAFSKMQHLVRLELSDCQISVVNAKAFAGLETSLEYLKLDGNRLCNIRSDTITSLTNLHEISLSRNRWNCSCALRPLRLWMLKENIPCAVPPICETPTRLAGKPWNKINLDDFACAPQIMAADDMSHGIEGRNITMSCYVKGVPEPSVRWMVKNRVFANLSAIDGDQITNHSYTAAATQGRKIYVVNMLRNASNFTITTVEMQDAGIYTCVGENKAGKVEASVILVVSRHPPEVFLSFKMILVFIALIFVTGSSVAAVCFCSLRRKRKLHMWNNVTPDRNESYEKIEMTSPFHRDVIESRCEGGSTLTDSKINLVRKVSERQKSCTKSSVCSFFHNDENGYSCETTTPLNCGSDDISDTGGTIINTNSGHNVMRNGNYSKIPTHCDDDDNENSIFIDNNKCLQQQQHGGASLFVTSKTLCNDIGSSGMMIVTTSTGNITLADGKWNRNAPENIGNGGTCTSQQKFESVVNSSGSKIIKDTDLHIPHVIEIGSAADVCVGSISRKVDANDRSRPAFSHVANWINESMSNSRVATANGTNFYTVKDEVHKSVFCGKDVSGNDLFYSNYPDHLDIAKYEIAKERNSTQVNDGFYTLPRKFKNTGKYYKISSDSQSPLLADKSSKYGSSTQSDSGNLSIEDVGRRFSAESSIYSNSILIYSKGQKSNSFLNLVHNTKKSCVTTKPTGIKNQETTRRNPSLSWSHIHELHQQHQKSFGSAATPLLDFSTLTIRIGTNNQNTGNTNDSIPLKENNTNATKPAYDLHAAQLERFLEEYRNLKDQLCKMKETCEKIRKKEVPLTRDMGQAAHAANPIMYSAALVAARSPTTNSKFTLKNKVTLPGRPPDPPPYWLHRNAFPKRMSEPQNEIFKS